MLEEAASTSHVAIVARSMNLPLIGSVEGISDSARAGDAIAIDGESGELHLRPQAEIVAAFNVKRELREKTQARFAALRDLPAVTKDGVPIQLMMNAGLKLDMPHLAESGADGIGLFRTELQFMIGETMPRLADQVQFYREILDSAGDKPVVFRTLDLGGDKVLPYARWEREENPALGWRAIRIALDRPALLRYQVRAMLMAAANKTLRILLPMVSNVDEFNRARALVDREIERARLLGLDRPRQVLVGAMLEVPSLAFMLPQLMRSADFVSIGSNDLLSFAFAVDRIQPAGRQALRRAQSRGADPDQADHRQLRRGPWRAVAVRRDGGQAAGRHGAAGPGAAHPVDASGQYRPDQADDPQHGPERGGALRHQAARPDRPQPADPADRLRRRARNRPEVIGVNFTVPAHRTDCGGKEKFLLLGQVNGVIRRIGWHGCGAADIALPMDQGDPSDAGRRRQYQEPPHPSARDFRRQRHPPSRRWGRTCGPPACGAATTSRPSPRRLKIRKDHLEAIEEDRLDALPGRTYAVGFVRSYADYLGLDVGQCVERFKPRSPAAPTPTPPRRSP
ncbi:MAG: putative PEP-binding protein [Rhizomicrobium sp.]